MEPVPFLVHTFLVKHPGQIQKLKHSAVRYVGIDPERGADCAEKADVKVEELLLLFAAT
jgi:hypothetical protein